jgi:uncharacterized FlgJ-related protein
MSKTKNLFASRLFLLVSAIFNLGFFSSTRLNAQPPQFKIYTYIETYSVIAIQQMIAHKIPASVTLAQAIYESSSGTSQLARKSNNHFGIKCHVAWLGDTIVKTDDTLNECFRKYPSITESYTDHSIFLASRVRYSALFNLELMDYKAWCMGLKEAGYATSPSYAQQLIKIIEENKLYELDGYDYLMQEIKSLAKEAKLKYSKYTGLGFSLKDLSRAGVLWLDPSSMDLHTLDLLIKQKQKGNTSIAGN